MNENYVKDQTEIDLRQLFWAICRRWRMVLCWMLAVAVIAGAFKAVSTLVSLRNTEETATAQATYDALVTNNRQERSDILKRLRNISEEISERHRHRYEFNNDYETLFEQNGLVISGTSPDGEIVETVELADHPFFIGVQFHPEFKSRPNKPHPIFKGFVRAACAQAAKAAE